MYSLIYMFTVCQCTIYVICMPLYTDVFPNPTTHKKWGFCNLICNRVYLGQYMSQYEANVLLIPCPILFRPSA